MCLTYHRQNISFWLKGYKFWYRGMRDLRARLALMAVALTIVGKISMSTIAPSKSGPKNGTFIKKTEILHIISYVNVCMLIHINTDFVNQACPEEIDSWEKRVDSGCGLLVLFNCLLVESTIDINVRAFIEFICKPDLQAVHSVTENSAFWTTTQRISHLTCSLIYDNSIFLLVEWMKQNTVMLLVLWYLCHTEEKRKTWFYCVKACLK